MTQTSLRTRLMWALAIWGAIVTAFTTMVVMFHFSGKWIWRLHFGFPIIAGGLFLVIAVVVVRQGLSPFAVMRSRLAEVRDGQAVRLEGEYPSEVAPLVEDLNSLLDERERRVTRAVTKAGDLAHGLKTPLAVLAQEIERADAAGQRELADSMRRQVERMRRQIDSHLAQARVTASGVAPNARAGVADAASALARTMERLHVDRALAIDVAVPADHVVHVAPEDLEEMLGNLLDNACKWARSCVRVSSALDGRLVVIDVDDDGAGLDESMRVRVLQRGVRADEAAPGSGFGLAIVSDLATAYGGSIALDRSPDGGVRARLVLPAQT